jgi:hypothetical protein
VNYTGAGSFSVQNDGQGGTLVFDPPATTVASVMVPPATMAIDAEVPLSGINGSDTHAASGLHEESLSRFASDSGGAGHVGKVLVDLVTDLSDLAKGRFAFEPSPASQPAASQEFSQSHQLKLVDGPFSNIATQGVTQPGRGDTFDFKPEMGATAPANISEHAGGKFVQEHATIENFAELQALMSPNQSGHDTLLNLGHGDVFTIAHVPPGQLHADGFVLNL